MYMIEEYMRNNPYKILDDFYAGILLTDKHKNVIYSNSAFQKLFRSERKESLGRKCWELMHPDDPDCKGCPKGLCHYLKVRINKHDYNLLVSGSSCGDDLILRVIQDVSKALSELDELRKEVEELRKRIEGLIGSSEIVPICAVCFKVRLIDGTWISPRDASALQTTGGLTHSYCPNCAKNLIDTYIADLSESKKKQKKKNKK